MSEERRTAFRFQIREEIRDAVLEVRRRRLPVELLDQSANGFSVKAPLDVDVEINELVAIETWSGRCDAIVARVSDHRDYRRLGLHRVTDLAPVKPNRASKWLTDHLPFRAGDKKQHGAAWAFASVAVVALVTIGWIATQTPQAASEGGDLAAADAFVYAPLAKDPSIDPKSARPAGVAPAKDVNEAAAVSTAASLAGADPALGPEPAAPSPGEVPVAPAAAILPALAPNETAAASGAASPPAAAAKPVARSTQSTLERLATLRTPKAAGELGLSEQQKLEISRLLSKVTNELARTRSRMSSKSRAARDAQIDSIIADAETRATAILSPEQQVRWKAN